MISSFSWGVILGALLTLAMSALTLAMLALSDGNRAEARAECSKHFGGATREHALCVWEKMNKVPHDAR